MELTITNSTDFEEKLAPAHIAYFCNSDLLLARRFQCFLSLFLLDVLNVLLVLGFDYFVGEAIAQHLEFIFRRIFRVGYVIEGQSSFGQLAKLSHHGEGLDIVKPHWLDLSRSGIILSKVGHWSLTEYSRFFGIRSSRRVATRKPRQKEGEMKRTGCEEGYFENRQCFKLD